MHTHPQIWVLLLASLDVVEVVLKYLLSISCHIATAIEWQTDLRCKSILPLLKSRVYIILQNGCTRQHRLLFS